MIDVQLKGNTVHTSGALPKVGAVAPDVTLVKPDLSEAKISSFAGKKVLNIFPSIDTGVCAASVRRFNKDAATKPDVHVLNISMDLPFAIKRFCAAEGIEEQLLVQAVVLGVRPEALADPEEPVRELAAEERRGERSRRHGVRCFQPGGVRQGVAGPRCQLSEIRATRRIPTVGLMAVGDEGHRFASVVLEHDHVADGDAPDEIGQAVGEGSIEIDIVVIADGSVIAAGFPEELEPLVAGRMIGDDRAEMSSIDGAPQLQSGASGNEVRDHAGRVVPLAVGAPADHPVIVDVAVLDDMTTSVGGEVEHRGVEILDVLSLQPVAAPGEAAMKVGRDEQIQM